MGTARLYEAVTETKLTARRNYVLVMAQQLKRGGNSQDYRKWLTVAGAAGMSPRELTDLLRP